MPSRHARPLATKAGTVASEVSPASLVLWLIVVCLSCTSCGRVSEKGTWIFLAGSNKKSFLASCAYSAQELEALRAY